MSTEFRNNANDRRQLIEQMAYLGQMLSTETAHFHHTAATKQGWSITDSKTVSALMQEGPMTAGQLAIRLSITTGAVTSVIDRLEKCGIVHRVADPNDRRKVIVRVDDKKVKEHGKLYNSMGGAFAKLLGNYSVKELRFLIEYYKAAVELTKQETAKLSK